MHNISRQVDNLRDLSLMIKGEITDILLEITSEERWAKVIHLYNILLELVVTNLVLIKRRNYISDGEKEDKLLKEGNNKIYSYTNYMNYYKGKKILWLIDR